MILVLHDAVDDGAPLDQADALVQANLVVGALERLGHRTAIAACDLDLGALAHRLAAEAPDLVFNLVESLGGHGRLIHVVPSLLDALGIPYTGAPAEAQYLTSHKLLAKRLLQDVGLPTPVWYDPTAGTAAPTTGRWIVKSVWEHASIGMDAESVVDAARADLPARITTRLPALGGSAFAEAFIDGREFNLSVLGGQVLPPAEIRFEDFPDGAPRIVDYAAKWDESAHAFHHTPRSFDFPAADAALLDQLQDLAGRAWRCFCLRGAARVDFRVDGAGRPWILEVNANPCLAPDAGFMAAVSRAGLTIDTAVARIVADLPSATGSDSMTGGE